MRQGAVFFPKGSRVSVIGLGKSGIAAAQLLKAHDYELYASDNKAEPSGADAEAVDRLRAAGVDVEFGNHNLEIIGSSAAVIVSPGVLPSAPPLITAHDKGIPVLSEIELALGFLSDSKYIAITGTNGKTTTTALVDHLLRGLGYDSVSAGNIGTPLSEIALREKSPDWIALEISSFQLHDTPSLHPEVGVMLNLMPDHLDRYASVDDYYADKMKLFANATAESEWVLNADDYTLQALVGNVAGTHRTFTVSPGEEGTRGDAFFARASNQLVVFGEPVISRVELPLIGTHNAANALAATLAVMSAQESHRSEEARRKIADSLRTFKGLPHRLEVVGTWGDVEWVNDSKATNVSSTHVAITGMTRPAILLMGGRHKGESYSRLSQAIAEHVKHVIAYGEAANIIADDLGEEVPVTKVEGGNFADVIKAARNVAVPGDTVLLSPACSSYDMFTNYEERGEQFRKLAQETGAK